MQRKEVGKGEVQYAPRKLLPIEDGLPKCVLASIRIPNFLDDSSLLGAISDVDLIIVSIMETESRIQQACRV